jgi:3'-phosphoadenosine 5'-phosphosulfate sulfotransferase (PAPS reductase)/FAD synthetase
MTAIIRPHGRRAHVTTKPQRSARYDYAHLKDAQGWTLDNKIAWAQDVITMALSKTKNQSVAFSAGKDSEVLLHLLLPYKQDIHVIYGNTTIEFPECVQFAKFLKQAWRLNFHEARPERSFWWVVENYGWPLLGKTYGVGGVAHKASRAQFFDDLAADGQLTGQYAIQAEVPISSACCAFLKERPSQQLQRQLGIDCVFLGILASESRQRMFNFLQYGEFYQPTSKNSPWKCHPLAIWTDTDIWAYIRRFNLPYAKLYDMGYHDDFGEWIHHKRNGCMFCGMDIKFKDNHLAIMRRTHPKIWNFLMKKKGLGQVLLSLRFAVQHHQYDLFASQTNLDAYLDKFPCVFDRM